MAMGAFRTGLAQSSEAARAGNAKKKGNISCADALEIR